MSEQQDNEIAPALSPDIQTGKAGEPQTDPAKLGALKIGAIAVFAMLFAYDSWEIIESALEFTQFLTLAPEHWAILVVLIIAPIVILLLAIWVARKRSFLHFILVLLVAWAVSAVVFLNLNFLLQVLILNLL